MDGSETKYSTLSRVEAGDIVVNKIWARNGSVAVVPEALGGAYVSGEFPTFIPAPRMLDPRWFHWFTKTPNCWEQCDEKSRGTSGKNRIRPEQFLAIAIPLPPLDEQQRIVARIEALAAKIQEARGLRREVLSGCDDLCRSILLHDATPAPTPMRALVKLREPDVTVHADESYDFAGVYCFGEGVFRGQRKSGMEFAYARLTRLRAGDFVYPKLMAWEGALGVVPPECEGLVVSSEFPVFEIDTALALPETLDVYFRTPSVWPTLAGASTGTNVRRRRLNPANFLEFEMPLPPMNSQRKLSEIKRRVDAMKRLQAVTTAEFDALLPSILDRAFRGKL
ncbi:MAG TPA: restriction endonuclease subunit S [Terriglobia bacterium]|nr:restriction endonuclease subunit S [Terriglobia bacterium]